MTILNVCIVCTDLEFSNKLLTSSEKKDAFAQHYHFLGLGVVVLLNFILKITRIFFIFIFTLTLG